MERLEKGTSQKVARGPALRCKGNEDKAKVKEAEAPLGRRGKASNAGQGDRATDGLWSRGHGREAGDMGEKQGG